MNGRSILLAAALASAGISPALAQPDATTITREHCKREWPTDFAMQAYCLRKQQTAVQELSKGGPSDIAEDVFSTVRQHCADEWPNDFAMREYCERKQVEGVRKLSEKPAGSAAAVLATLNGECTHLIYAGRDGTKACKGSMANSVHNDSRTGFTFVIGDIAIITFTGLGQQQVKDSPDVVTQPIDAIIFKLLNMDGAKPNKSNAVGFCTFGNPYTGHSSEITCTAHSKEGVYEAHFVTDGSEPTEIDPGRG